MSEPRPSLAEHSFSFRVRYPETDPIGVVHHSRFLQYFEMGRIELLRSLGHSYASLEARGVFFVVTRAEVKYRAPARFDEELLLVTRLVKATHVRFDHAYELRRDGVLLAEAATTIACVGRDGQLMAIPGEILPPRSI